MACTWEKGKLISGAFAQNFISSRDSEWFFDTFGRSIFSNLKRLRLCELRLYEENRTFVQKLKWFDQLIELDLFSFATPVTEFELSLPMLTSIRLEYVKGIKTLALDAPKLQKARLVECDHLLLVIFHGESVERLLSDDWQYTAVKNLKNLRYLYIKCPAVDSLFLSDLNQLKEIHLIHFYEPELVEKLFEQKRQLHRTDLKIYFRGLLLDGPDDPAIHSLDPLLTTDTLVQLAENPSRLADEIPFYNSLYYSAIERVAPEAVIDLVSRFSKFYFITVDRPIEDIERFLNLLKNSDTIYGLNFICDQPQELFDRLPEYSTLQLLAISRTSRFGLPDLKFLSRLEHLIQLELPLGSVDTELIRKIFEDLPTLFDVQFGSNRRSIRIGNHDKWIHPRPFKVKFGYRGKWTEGLDLEAAIQFLVENAPQKINLRLQ